jgi:redox-sensitive bicupin YhaK (pirin superfamily)
MTVQTQTLRTVAGIINSVETLEGAGFLVRRPFPKSSFSEFDPFLLLDELGPVNLKPGQAKGAPDHPHRGFETVSYVLEGRLEHKDSQGHAGLLNSGDVQWMTAGAGVVHSEMPEAEFTRRGGRLHGIQLWVNFAATRQDDSTPLSGDSVGSNSRGSNRGCFRDGAGHCGRSVRGKSGD